LQPETEPTFFAEGERVVLSLDALGLSASQSPRLVNLNAESAKRLEIELRLAITAARVNAREHQTHSDNDNREASDE
jgi:hypothetical protein